MTRLEPIRHPPPKPSTSAIIAGVVLIVMSIVAFANSGCVNQRRTTLAAELAALNTARDVFVKWDKAYQLELAHRAQSEGKTKDETKATVAAYRATFQAAVVRAFALAFGEIAAAAVDDEKPMPKTPSAVIKSINALKPGQDPPPVLCESECAP